MTDDSYSELPRSWRRAIKDPVYFARTFLNLDPHPGQVRWLTGSTGSENALITGNRWGKSQIQAVKLLHRALFQIRPPSRDIIGYYRAANVSITQDQAGIIFAKMVQLISRSKPLKALLKSIRQTPFPHIVLKNGSEIWARSTQNRGEYLLGHDFDYINFDEAAYEPYGEWVVDGVIKLRLADRNGVLDYSSTPNGLNWFFKRCERIRRDNQGLVKHGSTFENPHLSRPYLDDLKKGLSESRIAQHLHGQFTSFEGRLFPEEIISRCLLADTSDSKFRFRPEGFHIHGWDLARKMTHTVGITIDATKRPFRVIEIARMQREWPVTIQAIKDRHKRYGGVTIIDSTGLGDVVLSELDDIGAVGFNFGGGNRDLLLANFERAIFAGDIVWPHVEIPDGCSYWSLTDEIRAMDQSYINVGDGVCALALALWQVRERDSQAPFLRSSVGKFQ
ncbi:MAG: terminase family protein [candidate division Zixibacteria bacterium]